MDAVNTTRTGRAEKGNALKKQIYSCAIALFEKNGFDKVKVSDICKEANISVGTFYYYYPSKEAIFLGYAEAADDEMNALYEKLKDKNTEDKLLALIIGKVNLSTRCGAELCGVSLAANIKHNQDSAFDFHRAAYGYFMRTIEDGMRDGTFREDINLYSVTSMLRYIIGGLVTHWSIQSSNFDVADEAERLGRQFIFMLKNSPQN